MDKISELAAKLAPYFRQPRWAGITTPLTSTSWDGDLISDVSTSTEISLVDVFGCPSGLVKVQIRMYVYDTGTYPTSGLSFAVGPTSAFYYQMIARPLGGSTTYPIDKTEVVTVVNNKIFYRANASGTGTLSVNLQIADYMR